jgi:hypothetical protein
MKMKQISILLLLIITSSPAWSQIVLPSESDNKNAPHATQDKEQVERDNWSKFYSYPKAQLKKKYNVAVLTPLFLDSVDISKNPARLPKFMLPGIDFYQGVEIAADTLRKKGYHFDIHIFDSKSKYLNIQNIIESDKLDSMDLIIGNVGAEDLKILAAYAKQKEINFISAVSPSDADQQFNPFFTILQPRLQTHVEELHQMITRKFPEDNVIFVHSNKSAELNALGYFKDDILSPLPGRFKEYIVKGDELDLTELRALIDTNYHTTIVLGLLSPNDAFKNLKALIPLGKETRLKVFGMPTMEMINTLRKTESFPGMKIYYTTAFVKEKMSPATNYILNKYKQRMSDTPTDLVYKGFESIYFFAHMMNKYGVPFNEHITDNRYSFLTPYKILPIKENLLFKYFENKYLYMLSYENGVMTYE